MRYGERVRVLVVDDEDAICRALEVCLARAGYDVVWFLRGESALERVKTERFDVLLVDLRLRGDMRGDEFFHWAVACQRHLAHATLFMTGDITEIAQTLIGACKTPHLMKPFDLRDVLDAVAAMSPRVHNASA